RSGRLLLWWLVLWLRLLWRGWIGFRQGVNEPLLIIVRQPFISGAQTDNGRVEFVFINDQRQHRVSRVHICPSLRKIGFFARTLEQRVKVRGQLRSGGRGHGQSS